MFALVFVRQQIAPVVAGVRAKIEPQRRRARGGF
jgi:hypothetical protein